jgi:hypothetical protein
MKVTRKRQRQNGKGWYTNSLSTITPMAAPTTLPAILIRPRDNATASEARVTMKALSPAHQGLSECERAGDFAQHPAALSK